MKKINSKVVVFAREEDVSASKYEESYVDVMANDIIMLPNEKITEFNNLHNILGNKKISNNSVLICHPYKENYFINIEDSDEIIQREKLANTADLARLLGATKFEVLNISQQETEKKYEFDIEGRLVVNTVKLNVKKSINEDTKKVYSLSNTYPGASPDYQKAIIKLKEYGLIIDPEIKALVESRNPIDKNLLSSQKISLKTSSEINDNLEIAANLMALGGILNISTSFKKRISSRKSTELTINIEF
ncbi:hypothetical protein [Tenacibaculum finnmarkense]|uniref:hypothetical protein n=1 Tax=Tenacibaculum finnmarkense TaxID=2781243 RepID=UPI001EFAF89C|nr:hypothetical protein [Tenacibaculum finnmarkense]MCG8802865.1 hypothetical protein [Tenacibaculum finnmarkense]MCG8825593.1 hypothetical protein [Tenacibaculum finnmarkense]